MFITSLEDIDFNLKDSKLNKLYEDIDKLLIEKNIYNRVKEVYGDDITLIVDPDAPNFTSREFYINKCFHCSTFYYIERLMEINPSKILDLGCGANLFKNFYPIIYGIDPAAPGADEVDRFNSDFILNHPEEFECVMAINSLHHDITFSSFKKRFYEFLKIIKPGGRGYITMNSQVFLSNLSSKHFKYFFHENSIEFNVRVVRDVVNALVDQVGKDVNILEYHNLIGSGLNRTEFDIHLDGDIRILLEKF